MSSHSELWRSSMRVGVEDLRRLLDVRPRVGVDLLARELRARRRAPARIADARGVVADDEDDDVPAVLELAQLAQDDRVAEVDVRRRRVEAELDAQRPRRRRACARRPPAGRQSTASRARKAASLAAGVRHGANARVRAVRGAGCHPLSGGAGVRRPHGRGRSTRARMSDSERPDILVLSDPPLGRPRLKRLRLALILFGLSILALVSTAFGMMMAVASDLPELENREEFKQAQNSLLDRRPRHVPRDARRPGPDHHPGARHRAAHEARDHRDRGPALLPERRRRPPRHRRARCGRTSRAGQAVQGGSTITQQFVKNATQAQNRRTVLREGPRGRARLPPHAQVVQDEDPHGVPQLDLLRQRRLRDRVGRAHVLRPGRPLRLRQARASAARRCSSPTRRRCSPGMVASPSAFDPIANPRGAKRRRNIVLREDVRAGLPHARRVPREPRRAGARPATRSARRRRRRRRKSAAYFATWVQQQVIDRYGAREALRGRPARPDDARPRPAARRRRRSSSAGSATRRTARTRRSSRSTTTAARSARWSAAPTTPRSPFNLATQGQRQPGSAFKPFVLATALRRGISPDSTWESKRHGLPGAQQHREVHRQQLRRQLLRRQHARPRDDVLRQLGLRAGRHQDRHEADRAHGRAHGDPHAGVEQLRDHARRPASRASRRSTSPTPTRRSRPAALLVTGTLGAGKRGPVGIRKVTMRDIAPRRGPQPPRARTRVLPRERRRDDDERSSSRS